VSRTRYARSETLRIAFELRGTMHWRRPWLALIQGMGMDRRGWEPVLSRLRRHFRLVLVDNRGVGHSDLPAGSFTVADMAADVAAVHDAAGIRRAHVLGRAWAAWWPRNWRSGIRTGSTTWCWPAPH
jgi:pimeloyl-ACP methyl ester carboxylesterase